MGVIEARRRILLSAPHVEATAPAGVANFQTDLISPLKSLKAGFLPVQSGSGDPSPSNVRPISGWSGLTVYHSGTDTSNPTSIPVTFPASAGTVYGGYVDLVKGEVVAEIVNRPVTTFTGIVANHGNPNGNVFYLQTLINTIRNDTLISNRFVRSTSGYSSMPLYSFSGTWGATDYVYFVLPSTIQTLEDANAWLNDNPTEFVYKLAAPIHYPLTPQIIKSLRGTNNIWSDANGDVSVEYWKH